ncbi:glycerophosphodiester phosphodiesterase [Clostridium botulinum]|uniref:Glycerophosphoryl diester phosphodiesterase n=1 Tax=Clostridium botulinum (strain Okra / Type B1) TaxID=498213 RepID=B1INB7_CLOBK|nr:glycerophosphodiester phosphodiesterase [Clostridium botulinum]EKX79211.1 glycerophosphoryl diester phosphodiesterase [Clostridium botulinum CFSAN001628]ACA45391.1 glycerophosphoryl diester phosphodiesterase [Clostridium botulinum B1 str. Okra]MBD5563608.1 glycerophosphodiester phosphodiesterase [Clostridium botulinum]MBD5568349.1 glycerophosphodiester phosphodiesterase [Clostridium botulinum]MBD5572080.1 glycerophosphodiester phosphodiesterase [Clostridium botulinum]
MKNFPLNIAHRGASSLAPENTLESFKKAIELRCDGIELDVHMTRDNQLVVIHDEFLDRTTNGIGSVRNLTLNEIKRLDAGSYFSNKFKEAKIPTLKEVLDLIVPSNILLDVEIKQWKPEIERNVITMIQNYKYEKRTIITSFNPMSVLKCKQISKDIKTGLLAFSLKTNPLDIKKKLKIDYLVMDANYVKLLSQNNIDILKKNNLKILTFTVDKKEDMAYMIKHKVDGIITNKPQLLNLLKYGPFSFIR